MRLAYLAAMRLPTEKAYGHQIAQMCQAFCEAGAETELLHPGAPGAKQLSEEVLPFYGISSRVAERRIATWDPVSAVQRLNLPVPSPAYTARGALWALVAAREVARSDDHDLVFVRDPQTAAIATRFGLPVILEIHRISSCYQRTLLRTLTRRPTLRLLVALSEGIKSELVGRGFDPAQVLVEPNAVSLERFENLPSRNEARRLVGIQAPDSSRVVGYVGKFEALGAGKGLATLIEALAVLHREGHRDVRIMAVGGPVRDRRYERLAQRHGLPSSALDLRDHVPAHAVPTYMAACDALTVPSPPTRYHAQQSSPLKLFEYMASGVPIVASDLPTIREVAQHGVSAWLVPPGDAQALGAGLREVMGTPLGQALASNARAAVEARTWLDRARHILEAVAARGEGPPWR